MNLNHFKSSPKSETRSNECNETVYCAWGVKKKERKKDIADTTRQWGYTSAEVNTANGPGLVISMSDKVIDRHCPNDSVSTNHS